MANESADRRIHVDRQPWRGKPEAGRQGTKGTGSGTGVGPSRPRSHPPESHPPSTRAIREAGPFPPEPPRAVHPRSSRSQHHPRQSTREPCPSPSPACRPCPLSCASAREPRSSRASRQARSSRTARQARQAQRQEPGPTGPRPSQEPEPGPSGPRPGGPGQPDSQGEPGEPASQDNRGKPSRSSPGQERGSPPRAWPAARPGAGHARTVPGLVRAGAGHARPGGRGASPEARGGCVREGKPGPPGPGEAGGQPAGQAVRGRSIARE